MGDLPCGEGFYAGLLWASSVFELAALGVGARARGVHGSRPKVCHGVGVMSLGERLEHLRGERPIVFALSEGAAPLADEIAAALAATGDVLAVRRLRAPRGGTVVGAIAEG